MIAQMRFTMPPGSPDTCICIDTAFLAPSNVLTHVDTLEVGYTPIFTAKCFPVVRCCPPPEPSLTQWGLIILLVVLAGIATWVVLKRRRVVTA